MKITSLWSGENKLYCFLLPLAWLYGGIVNIRRWAYQKGIFKSYRSPVPVIIIGNLSVGGNGKTPVTLYLIEALKQRGFKVGVITRGYGGKSEQYPFEIGSNTTTQEAGDEPTLMYQRTGVPIAVSPKRSEGIQHLIQNHPEVDLILADDGLQHYAIKRDIEIVVIDGKKGFGNGHFLPAGPLREKPSRLNSVDYIIINGKPTHSSILSMNLPHYSMQLKADQAVNLCDETEVCEVDLLSPAVAMAGIGDPSRFFETLTQLGVKIKADYGFPDHHNYTQAELMDLATESEPLIMTEKDKVKCTRFAQKNWWYLPVNATLPDSMVESLVSQLKQFKKEV